MLKRLKYRLWLFFGGRRTEEGFKFLSDEILAARKREIEMKATIRKLELRVWELEKHTPQETVNKISESISRWEEMADKRC